MTSICPIDWSLLKKNTVVIPYFIPCKNVPQLILKVIFLPDLRRYPAQDEENYRSPGGEKTQTTAGLESNGSQGEIQVRT